jgi:alpha-ketoglutarate-dependent taurine dioxygenase
MLDVDLAHSRARHTWERLDAALVQDRLVVIRKQRLHESTQLRVAAALGTLVDAQPGCAATEFADTAAAYAGLAAGTRQQLATRHAFHHVARSRAVRYGRPQPARRMRDGSGPRVRDRMREELARLPRRMHARPPDFVDVPGARHPVVDTDSMGRSFVRAGDHAWAVEGMDETAGISCIDNLNRMITARAYVYEHEWAAGDVVIFDNLSCCTVASPRSSRGAPDPPPLRDLARLVDGIHSP